MHEIEIGLNTQINPHILTTHGTFCTKNHGMYISCKHSSIDYAKHGWYVGTVWVGDSQLQTTPSNEMSKCLKQIEEKVNTNIACKEHGALGTQLYQRITEICQELHTYFPEKEFKIQHYYLQVPEIANTFSECMHSSC